MNLNKKWLKPINVNSRNYEIYEKGTNTKIKPLEATVNFKTEKNEDCYLEIALGKISYGNNSLEYMDKRIKPCITKDYGIVLLFTFENCTNICEITYSRVYSLYKSNNMYYNVESDAFVKKYEQIVEQLNNKISKVPLFKSRKDVTTLIKQLDLKVLY